MIGWRWAAPFGVAALPAGARALHGFGLLWGALLALTLTAIAADSIPIAIYNPILAAALALLAGAVGLAVLHLSILRFNTLGSTDNLLAGLGFGTLALTNLLVRVLPQALGSDLLDPEPNFCLILGARTVAAGLFVLALVLRHRMVPAADRRVQAVRAAGELILVLALGAAAIVLARGSLPAAIDATARTLLDAQLPVWDALYGQQAWVLAANGAVALLLLVAAVGFARLPSRRAGRSRALAFALTLLFFSQVHGLLFPAVALDYVSTSDLFRLAAYLVLLFSLAAGVDTHVAEQVSHAERLRLSRELHDGLAQHLSLLHLRLSRAAAPHRSGEQRTRELESARRLVEVALLEARGAITALRTETIAWESFRRTVSGFAEEFAENNGVDVTVWVGQAGPAVEAHLQVDILRILHEAFSNAIRHGAATRLRVDLSVAGDRLEVRVEDNGSGMSGAEPPANGGVGLNSMRERLEARGGTLLMHSADGGGVTLRARLPVPDPE
jgi:signal transduction histidine kinase